MEGYCVPRTQLPERLYRVQYDKSITKDMEPGLVATDMQHFTAVQTEFGTLVERHINNLNDQGNSIFISTFSNKAKAEDWMCRKWRVYGKGAQILEIETRHLGHGYVYRAGAVAQSLKLDISHTTYDDLCSEYLILHFVPARAIVARRAKMIIPNLESAPSTRTGSICSDESSTRTGSICSDGPSPRTGSMCWDVTEISTLPKRFWNTTSLGSYPDSDYSDDGSPTGTRISRRSLY
ncbi:hypothetical protein N7491_001646 [Penicillium cf. griseofulvum]|uniref:DUF7587 domain-containing protein n=1 Tax=Penicillium cf. griseofulvum TaxID=2972120 RepID=A0A9W9JC19_9EURO|nr:hypothetical protein N7472_006775 [Penicillium cf. griseofulvum]KAJ5445564.1 hypothetical protein N7491_001646 [Penicillium cf. griseofulvum]KAJ5447285.1 hypothetical protein N7445_002106 [Penicillium cf. griseofulvum]